MELITSEIKRDSLTNKNKNILLPIEIGLPFVFVEITDAVNWGQTETQKHIENEMLGNAKNR